MKKKNTKKPNPAISARGPIARKVIATARQQLTAKITDLDQYRSAKVSAENFEKTVISEETLNGYDPIHGIYIYAQNKLSVIIEQLAELPLLDKIGEPYSESIDEYMPSSPPNSPLTTSYFTSWGAFDLSTNGLKKESLATVAIDFCKFMRVDDGLIHLYELMQASRMGLYKVTGHDGEFIILEELITHKKIKAYHPLPYKGEVNQIWYVRILPSPYNLGAFDYPIIFTTPYILGKNKANGTFDYECEQDWLDFFERNLIETGIEDTELAYEHLMKYGLSKDYWNEYIFLAYRNYEVDCIFLEGIPDINASLPHSEEGRERLGATSPYNSF
jgi:hypothetical protein